MNRLPNGILPRLAEKTGISAKTLSDYAATTKTPGRARSIKLEEACRKMGLDVSRELWMFGNSDKIKAALSTPVSKNNRNHTR